MNVSIVVPAYNEEKRIESFLKELTDFCSGDHEIIVVNDGSLDKTKEVVSEFDVNLISYEKNRGKGYAVRKGVLAADGDKILFIDADGSISPEEIPKMLKLLEENKIVVGVRNSDKSEIKNPQPFYRVLMGKIFNHFSNMILDVGVSDMLCGFKGFDAEIARELFTPLTSYRWSFDVEIMHRARKKGYNIVALPIKWSDSDGSKMSTLLDPPKIFLSLLKIRWKID